MANLNVTVQDGNNINVEVTPTPRQTIVLDRGVAGVGIESVAIVFQDPIYYLEFTYTNGTTELVALPAIATGVVSFNTRIGVVTLTSLDVTDALGYTPPEPDGTGATGTWAISVTGNAATVTNGVVTTGSYSDPAWITALAGAKIVGDIAGNAGTVTNGVYTTDVGTVTNTMLAGSIANDKLVNSTITINGTSTSLGGSVSVGTITEVSGTAPISSTGGTTPAISISQSSASTDGYLSSTDWNAFNSKTSNTGTVTSVAATAGTGISVSGSPITTSGTLTITNTAPDQVVSLTGAGTTAVTGTYPNFTITSDDQFDGTVTSVSGTGSVNGITLSGTVTESGNLTLGGTLSNVSLTTQVTGTLPIANGGTNATTAADARTSLGLGTSAVLNAAVALGTATLDAGGTVPLSQIPASIQGGLIYQGTWDASTNTPTLTSSVGTKGHYYAVSVAGSTNLNGITDWNIGDLAVYNGTVWEQIDNTDAVTSVNGYTGSVVLTTSDVAEGTNQYFTQSRARQSISAGTGITYDNTSGIVTNAAPDQTVSLTGTGTTNISGTYPNFTINSEDQFDGTVTSVAASAGTGISVSGSPITSSGTITITNTAPDQVVSITGAGTAVVTGTYPNFTVTANDEFDGTVTSVAATAGTGISVTGSPITSSGTLTITNTAPDQVVSLIGAGTTSITGTYPNFTITSNDEFDGDVVASGASTDNALVRYDGTTGKLIQNSQVILDDNGNATNINAVTFDVTPTTPPTAEGSLYWDNNDSIQTLNLVMAGGNATQHIGEETYYRVKASSAITNGQVVMFTGTLGSSGGLTAAPATGLTAATASYVMGIATQDIPLNGWGYVTHFGEVKQLNTSAFADGAILYYDPTVAGGLTATLPTAPNPKIQVCAVVNSSATVGILFVRPAFGGILGQYEGDVQVTSPANGQLLIRDQTAGRWVNATLTDGTGISVTEGAGSVTVTNTAPDQVVSITGGGTTTVTGTYPNFTVSSDDQFDGTVTSVGGTGTVNGITLTGTVTSSGNLTLGGTLSGVDLTTQVTGTLPVANGGTGLTSVTANRVPYGNGTSALQTSANLTFDGITLTNTGNAVISDNSTSAALRITQVGTGNALLVEDSANPDSTPFVINGDGNVIQGATSFTLGSTVAPFYALVGANAFGPQFVLQNKVNDGSGGYYIFRKDRNGTIVQSGDDLGSFSFTGFDGSSFLTSAQIFVEVDGTPGTNDMPGRLVFATTADGSSSPTERMRIDNAGRVGIGSIAPSSVPGATLFVNKSITGGVVGTGVAVSATIASDVTVIGRGFSTDIAIQNATFTIPDLQHYVAIQGTKGASATVTNQYGFNASSTLTGATNNYGFFSNIASGTGRWNFYAAGSAANYFAGNVGVGTTNLNYLLKVAGSFFAGRDDGQGVNITGDGFGNYISSQSPAANQKPFFIRTDANSTFMNVGTIGDYALGLVSNNIARLVIGNNGQTRFVPLASDPAGAQAGDVYYNSSTNKLKVYNGTSWIDLH